jgi:flagellar motor component MotA
MSLPKEIFIKSFQNIESTYLKRLSNKTYYSDQTKPELIDELNTAFEKIKKEGISKLEVRLSKCLFCFPNADVIEAYHNDKLMIRYVISKNSEQFIFQPCKNIPIPDRDDSIPF